MTLKSISFPDPYQYKEILPGEHAVVWRHRVSGNYVAFVNRLGVNWYGGTYYNWKMDSHLQDRIERTIQMTEPQKFDPPVVAEKEILFIGYNNSSDALDFGVYVDGVLCKPQ